MKESQRQELAALLYWADRMRFQIPPLSRQFPQLTEEEGYQIQEELLRRWQADGEEFAGRKIGGVSYGRKISGGYGFHYGSICKKKVLCSGDTLLCSGPLRPGLEAEVAVRLARDLSVDERSTEEISDAIEALIPAWEIVESRQERVGKTLADSLADNASSGGCVLGEPVPVSALNGQKVGVMVQRNGEAIPCETGTVSLPELAESLPRLLAALAQRGEAGLRKEEIILTGALTRPLFLPCPGDTYTACFDRLGSVKVLGS